MDTRRWSALILVAIMALAGCLGATEPLPEIEEPTSNDLQPRTHLDSVAE